MPAWLHRFPHFVFLFPIALILGGCYSSPALVVLRSPQLPGQTIGVRFPHACFAKSPSGEDQIVLLHEPIDDAPEVDPSKPLPRQTAPALWQVLKIELHWRTAPAGFSDSPVANNAVLHWYIYGDPGDVGASYLHYVGSGAVTFSSDGSVAKVAIHQSELSLADQHGVLRDPMGTFQINGRFKATADPAELEQIIEDLNKATNQTVPTTQP